MACMLEFEKNDCVVSLVCHLPEIMPGTEATICSGRIGDLYAVQLPNGELHRWLAGFELQPCNHNSELCPGSYARILTAEGHGEHIMPGMVVKIVKALRTDFYDAFVHGEYHRWFAGFEIVPIELV